MAQHRVGTVLLEQGSREMTAGLDTSAGSIQMYARAAGVLSLLSLGAGGFGEAYVPGALVVSGDAAATAANILTSESLFRWGFAVRTFARVLAPSYSSPLLHMPAAAAFLALTVWLLVTGVDTARWKEKAARAGPRERPVLGSGR